MLRERPQFGRADLTAAIQLKGPWRVLVDSGHRNEYVEHYHAERNHQGKGNVLLFPRDTDTRREQPVQCRERLGGLLRYYHQEAA